MSTDSSIKAIYRDPENAVLPDVGLKLDLSRTALVVIDPQVDFLSPNGVTWALVGNSVTENGVVGHLGQLFEAAKNAGITVAVSPHYYYPCDHQWEHGGPLEKMMHDIGMFDRASPLDLSGFDGSGADFMPQYKPFILDGKTIICSPHKVYGPQTNDLTLQLRKKGVSQVILAGMAANLCVESHLRDLVEQGFEVIVVRDATAAPQIPEGDGYHAALINYRFIASALWTTEQVVERLQNP
ncbi:cysteine hydrolase family protein [Pseudomonas sp. NPDC088444]|uniref:cysteine hydrolase family protein n=1 Tax=Pseudomonas sp. NPDC088444 TaxID=3364456 RepID=UPI00384C2934